MNAVRRSLQQLPKRSCRKHARGIPISDRSVWQILHQNLRFHPYNMDVVQQLYERDNENRVYGNVQTFLKMYLKMLWSFLVMKHIFTYQDALTIKISNIGVNGTIVNLMKILYIMTVLLYGAWLEELGLLVLTYLKRMMLL